MAKKPTPKKTTRRRETTQRRTNMDRDGGQSWVRGNSEGRRALAATGVGPSLRAGNPSIARAGERRGPSTSPRPKPRPRRKTKR